MSKKFFLIGVFISVFFVSIFAKQIPQEQTLAVAKEMLRFNNDGLRNDSDFDLRLVYTAVDNSSDLRASGEVLYYVYNVGKEGFVVVSANDIFFPIVAYSLTGTYDPEELNSGFALWMKDVEYGMSEAIKKNQQPTARAVEAWDAFLSGNSVDLRSTQAVSLLETKWTQDNPFNLLCPKYSSNTTRAGCVAVAMAQIMNYWKYPKQGVGVIPSYTTITHSLKIPEIDLSSHTYDWSLILPEYTEEASEESKMEVATLMYHCAVALNTDFRLHESSAYAKEVGAILKNYFGYDKSLSYKKRNYYSNDDWTKILKKELDAGRPILYTGRLYPEDFPRDDGHTFLCAGYDALGLFLFNWGREYDPETYLTIDNVEYPHSHEIIIGIKPDKNGTDADSYEIVIGPNTENNYYPDILVSDKDLMPGVRFTAKASFWNIGFAKFNGYLGFVLLDSKGKSLGVVGSTEKGLSTNLEINQLTGLRSISCVAPANLPKGIYTLKAAILPSGKKDWQIVNAAAGNVSEIELRIGDFTSLEEMEESDIVIYQQDDCLTINTPFEELVSVYNLQGKKLVSNKKGSGLLKLSIGANKQNLLVIKGSTGWTRKVFIK